MSGKHSSDEEFDFGSIPWKKIGIVLIVIIAIIAFVCGIYFGVKTYQKKKQEELEKQKMLESQEPDKDKMPIEIEGYKVLGKIVIDKIEIDEYILDSFEDKALEKGVRKVIWRKLK